MPTRRSTRAPAVAGTSASAVSVPARRRVIVFVIGTRNAPHARLVAASSEAGWHAHRPDPLEIGGRELRRGQLFCRPICADEIVSALRGRAVWARSLGAAGR